MKVKGIVPAEPDFPLRLWVSRVCAQVSALDYDGRQLWLRWVEPGRSHYGEQRWLLVAAKRSGYCILSGLPIRRGEMVFRPWGRPPPPNADKMILSQQVELALAGNSATVS
jgi:Domain of unknown function (DUF3331)